MSTTITPQAFVAKWQKAKGPEHAASQEHFIDLCRLLGHPTPTEADPAGKWFTFEAGASKMSGGQGWADVWKMGHFAWEYKGQHANLDKAYAQLLQYRESLLNPPLLIVSDMQRIIVHTNFTNTAKRMYELALEDLLEPAKLEILRKAFTDPDALRPSQTPQQVTEEAARQFGRLAELLRRYGNDPHATAHFLIRLLFCLFAEDANILPRGLFTRLVTQPQRTSQVLTGQLRQLFAAMAAGGAFGAEVIPHVDGGLFDDDAALDLDSESRAILADVSRLDWSAIKPSILGTLFERSLDPGKRSQLGAHYTGEEDILLIVEPVLMAPLRRRWGEVKAEAAARAEKRDLLAGSKPSPQKTKQLAKIEGELFGLLRGFRAELAAVQVLDAACGSGNFLYVSLRLLLDLEKEAINLAASLGDSLAIPMVSPAQLHGIEINSYAYELAQTTIWIGYIQWWRDNGFGQPEEPILKPLEAIRLMDAIMSGGEGEQGSGGAKEPEWPEAYAIIGNPPFLGVQKMRSELGDKYVEDLRALYADRVPAGADLVTYWFEKARAQIEAGKAKRVGLLATQAIRRGSSHKVLQRIKSSGDIFWAQSDRPWVLEGAAVRVSMVGFDGGAEKQRSLDGAPVEVINSDLTSKVNLTEAKRLSENVGICFEGVKKYGAFDITADVAQTLLLSVGNPNGRPNSDVVRRWVNGSDLVGRSREMWIVDFGVDMPLEQAAMYQAPFEYVALHVRPERAKERVPKTRDLWWLFERPRPDLRQALSALPRFIATSRVSRHRIFAWLTAGIVPDSRLYAFARDDDYFFGVLHSRLHEVWALATSSRHGIGNDPTYNNTTCFETFPFPWSPGQEPAGDARVEAIAEAARALVAQRDAWLHPAGASEAELKQRTLTNLYNARPTWLDLAHRRLDAAVLEAYGWPRDLSDEELLARLLALNLERAGAE